MGVEETKHDLFLKRAQVVIAILVGIATLILTVYNVKKNVFSKNSSEQPAAPSPKTTPRSTEKIQSALDEVGSSWIKKFAAKDSDGAGQSSGSK